MINSQFLIVLLPYLVKYPFYSLYCKLGIRLFMEEPPRFSKAAKLGLVRCAVGALVITVPYLFVTWGNYKGALNLGFGYMNDYFIFFIPLRWLAWSITEVLMRRSSLMNILLPSDWTSFLWRLGGISVSMATDVPVFLAGIIIVGC